jgi:hypothetical protein
MSEGGMDRFERFRRTFFDFDQILAVVPDLILIAIPNTIILALSQAPMSGMLDPAPSITVR